MSGKSAFLAACALLLAAVYVAAEDCDKSKCKGPVRYYEDLNCQPIYAKEGDCCAIRYNCSNLEGRDTNKCYVNGHEYTIGEELKDEDKTSPCQIGCTCTRTYAGIAGFTCAIVDCFHEPVKPGCYLKQEANKCCGGEEICPNSKEQMFKCEVDGKTYMDGESFYPNDNPQLSCLCMEGYKGENVSPFCNKTSCGVELRHSVEIQENCAPVFYSSQSPTTSCSVAYRCQNDNDTVIHSGNERSSSSEEKNENMMCRFGNMRMNIGDELNQATDYSSVCVKCVCEVPPTPTCRRLPDDECDVTAHPKFQ